MAAPDLLQSGRYGCLPDKRLIGRSFSAAAERYDGIAGLQRAAGEKLLFRLAEMSLAPERVVDLGSGTGYLATRLIELYPNAELVALDIAEGMLRFARSRYGASGAGRAVCGDAEAMPFRDRTMDLVFSNVAIQWCSALGPAFREIGRVLKPDGVVLFSTFGTETLKELRSAWASVDDHSHVNQFGDTAAVKAALYDVGFGEVEVAAEVNRLEYRSVYDLMRELKALGAHNVTLGRPRHLTGKGRLREMIAAYEEQTDGNGIEASFELVFGYAKGPAE
ncbi:malonyl-[acyl-carrier protein] O-methyltransferase [Methylocaldum marinum]|uniref:Malonyl-[acyl-carrier protein] O-methyltransferase n=1 Tax=Methylocaldum marinum TaxID=1432792 RepID=A0A250KY29_9GAMM|nr:malonyl-ACP O-methyltransferase BioC [Methylocaldum marinum]BBA36527.1 malonyl-[acyl-carrier protein] O-methyltransferase [Methylocaldum marinum]